jgi:hypothetical protein
LGIRATIIGLCGAASLLLAAGAQAQSPSSVVGPYDGQIPFKCELQQLGTGTEYPDPEADPLCVEFDKTNQNVTDLGIVDFAAQEPARVAAAGTKCFYFQRDHWTGTIEQGQEPELWHWDGDYWYDRARGVGGVSVRNYRIGGQPQNASPYVPEAYKPYFDEDGGGGVEVLMDTGPSPDCAGRVDTPEERNEVYGDRAEEITCIDPSGGLSGKRVGPARLGGKRERLRGKLGPPTYTHKRIDSWCLIGKGEIRVAYEQDGRATAILTSGRGHSFHGVSRGDRVRRAFRRLDVIARTRLQGQRLLAVESDDSRNVVVGVRHGRVRWLVVADDFRRDLFAHLIRHVT